MDSFFLLCSASLPTAPASMQDWDAFCRTFPVTLNGDPPSKEQCIKAGFPHYRPYYHKWRDLQLRQRTQYIQCKHCACLVNGGSCIALKFFWVFFHALLTYIIYIILLTFCCSSYRSFCWQETWTTNKPTGDGLLKAWVPPQQKIEDNSPLICSIAEQKWKGLALKDFGEEKGKGKCTYHLDSNHLLKGSEYFYVHIMTDAFLFFFSQVLSHLCPSVKGILSVIITDNNFRS